MINYPSLGDLMEKATTQEACLAEEYMLIKAARITAQEIAQQIPRSQGLANHHSAGSSGPPVVVQGPEQVAGHAALLKELRR
ncbi:hypothetical protein F2Q68_00008323 [Brassica cretica]|uniref:Uncharacterized protein n=1 Tax=Brassica cretica TaxID=69181 RepID=A0A8S9KYA3_BRACR|nr:hypothetical protein F2Q68_00008323 [Brassica cretica]